MTVGYVVDRWAELSQTFVSNEIAELQRQGSEVAVLALHRGGARPPQDVDAVHLRDSPSGATNLRHHVRWLARRPLGYVAFLLAVLRYPTERGETAWKRLPWAASELERRGVDRLHAHFAWAGAAAADALAALTGWPWALTVHARDVFTPRPAVRAKLDRADVLVTVCAYNERYLRDLGVRRPIAQVVCGVEVPEAAPGPAEHDVIAVGRLVEKKGFDVLVRAFGTVRARRPGSSLLLIGDGEERAALADLVAHLGLVDAVRLVGALPHDEVLDHVARSKVLCLPARVARDGDADSMPLVVKEAMARSVAVVATPVGGLPELVDEEVGAVVPSDDPEALAVALVDLLEDDERRARLGQAGRARVEERFTLSGEVATLRNLLRDMA